MRLTIDDYNAEWGAVRVVGERCMRLRNVRCRDRLVGWKQQNGTLFVVAAKVRQQSLVAALAPKHVQLISTVCLFVGSCCVRQPSIHTEPRRMASHRIASHHITSHHITSHAQREQEAEAYQQGRL